MSASNYDFRLHVSMSSVWSLAELKSLAPHGHILISGNLEDPDFCRKLIVCQDADVEWMLSIWILGHTSLHFPDGFLFSFLAGSWPLAAGHILTLGNFEDPVFCQKHVCLPGFGC